MVNTQHDHQLTASADPDTLASPPRCPTRVAGPEILRAAQSHLLELDAYASVNSQRGPHLWGPFMWTSQVRRVLPHDPHPQLLAQPVMDELILRFFADARALPALRAGEVDAIDDFPVRVRHQEVDRHHRHRRKQSRSATRMTRVARQAHTSFRVTDRLVRQASTTLSTAKLVRSR